MHRTGRNSLNEEADIPHNPVCDPPGHQVHIPGRRALEQQTSDLDLRRYWTMLWKWWWLFVVCAALAGGTSYYVSKSMTPVYQATATLLVGSTLQSSDADSSDVRASIDLAKTYSELLRGSTVLQATIDAIGLGASWQELQQKVSVQLVRDTQLIKVSVDDFFPEWAQRIANELAYQLILRTPTHQLQMEQDQQRAFVQEQLDDLKGRISTAQVSLSQLEDKLAGSDNGEAAALKAQADALRSQIYSWRDNYAQLLSYVRQPTPNYLSIVEPAPLPAHPISPKTRQNVMLAVVVGLMVAGGVALVVEFLDDSIKSVDEIQTRLGLTALGAILRLPGASYPEQLITHDPSPRGAAEAYRMLQSNIEFVGREQQPRTILVTSAGPVEGKSVTAANLAVVTAQSGRRVILVDADMRRPVQHHIFDLNNEKGLSTALKSMSVDPLSLVMDPGIDNLWVLPSGPVPGSAANLVSSPRMPAILDALLSQADVVILDSPPVLSVADASLLANRLDATLLVTDAGHTSIQAATRAVEQLRQAGANMLGGVLNRIDRGSGYGYYYYYYSSDGEKTRRKGRRGNEPWWSHIPLVGHRNGRN